VKKPKPQLAPAEDLLAEIPVVVKPPTVEPLSDDWLEDFTFDDKNTGVGDDGGQFEFGTFEEDNPFTDNQPTENENDTKKDDHLETSDMWITQLTKLDNPLQPIEKPKEKLKKGKSMADMQSKKKDLTEKFDDNFLKTINAGLSGQPDSVQITQPPQVNDPLFDNNKSSGLGNPNQPNVVVPNSGQMLNFNDPFTSLGGKPTNQYATNNGPVPATYQKPAKNDPFSTLNWK